MRKPLLLALGLLGLWDSVYLWWAYTSPSLPMVCVGTACDVVRASPYASLWGFPLPAYGAAMYATLVLLVFVEPLLGSSASRWVGGAIGAIAGAGFLVSLGLTGIEAFVLHAWCAWCVLSALTITCFFALALVEIFRPVRQFDASTALRTLRGHVVVVLLALAAGVPAFLYLQRHGEASPPTPTPALSAREWAERLVRPDSHVTGNPQSPLTIVEFGDFECPYCKNAELAAREIRKQFGKHVRFVFRQFPLRSLHRDAERAAEASECAAEQGKFWEAVDKLYDRQSDLGEPALERYADELGLDKERFRRCLKSGAMAGRVQRDLEDGRAIGVGKTPTFFIDQQKFEGPIPLPEFARIVNEELLSRAAFDQKVKTSEANRNQAKPSGKKSPQSSFKPLPDAKSAESPFQGNNPSSFFSQFQDAGLACSEEEAKKYQPILIRTPEARQYFERGSKALFVDVRTAKDFERGRIRGAINLPVEEIARRWSDLPKDRTIVFYESGASTGDVCASSRAAARVLLAHGFPPGGVRVYQDGLAGWEKAGGPVER